MSNKHKSSKFDPRRFDRILNNKPIKPGFYAQVVKSETGVQWAAYRHNGVRVKTFNTKAETQTWIEGQS